VVPLSRRSAALVSAFFILIFCLLNAPAVFPQTIRVYDGSAAGVDLDRWSDPARLSANWTIDFSWETYASGLEKRYFVQLEEFVSGNWNVVDSKTVQASPATALPPTRTTFSGLSLDMRVTLLSTSPLPMLPPK